MVDEQILSFRRYRWRPHSNTLMLSTSNLFPIHLLSPSRQNKKPRRLPPSLVSLKEPATSPRSLILMGTVLDALGGSKTVKSPLMSSTKPRLLSAWVVSPKYPATSPRALIAVTNAFDAFGASKTVISLSSSAQSREPCDPAFHRPSIRQRHRQH